MSASSRKAIIAALIGNSLIAVTKFIASAMTGSSAMLSEGIHSVVDTGNQLLLLYGIKRSSRPADQRFPYGYGKELYFWSFVVAILIFAVGAGLSIYEGIDHLIHPVHVADHTVNYIVLGLAIVFEGYSLTIAMREFNHQRRDRSFLKAVTGGKDPTIFVVVFEDSAAMLGLLVALVGVTLGDITGNPYFDGAASVTIGLLLAATAAWLAYETKGLLIGESADPRVVEGIRRIAGEHEEVLHVNEVLTLHMGPEFILVTMSVDFRDDLAAGRIERAVCALDSAVKDAFPKVKKVYIEAEPCKVGPVRV
ncbi:MAG: cation diffusion facilitator family transporter [Oceanidesulfovibrio sp.]